MQASSFLLSKSSYVKGMQCSKYLYLSKHKPKEKTPHSSSTLKRFSAGRNFESEYRQRFPDAIDVSKNLGKAIFSEGATYTTDLLKQYKSVQIFEACFFQHQVLVMTDVLIKSQDGTYHIYEIKNSSVLKEVFIWDLSLQYYICKSQLKKIDSFNLILIDEENGFKALDLTEKLEENREEVKNNITIFKEILLADAPPYYPVDEHCLHPYRCEFLEYCQKTLF